MKKPKKILILGSGALKIGEAGEFDYSGSQAIKALKEEKIKTVLVNPNIATIQTSKGMADKVYFLPVKKYFVEKIIKKEKPDGIMLAWGGQTALNCGVALAKAGILKKYKIKVYGSSISAIQKTEDRYLFKRALDEIGIKFAKSIDANNVEEGLKAAKQIGYPVMARAAYVLGGGGSGIAKNEEDLQKLLKSAFSYAPQVLIEESLHGWKEIEYEIMRDKKSNTVSICNMENFDPLGIHTGESIVIAPSQTLNNREYQLLRTAAFKVINHLKIIGECNIQFALDPVSEDYRVIEVNARLSRSSALASKATGYPIAYIAAKLGLGYSLPELRNSITQVTTSCFEPALDYIALKIPRWDLEKFRKVKNIVSSEMKSVGEIMAIGRSFEEVLQKGIRMLQIGVYGLSTKTFKFDSLKKELTNPTPKRVFAVAAAIEKGFSIKKIYNLTHIDPWFLYKIKNIVNTKKKLKRAGHLEKINKDLMLEAKKNGFCDGQIETYASSTEEKTRKRRKTLGVTPVVKQIDTMAAEFPAKTNYLYLTYHGNKDDIPFKSNKKKTVILGSGAYCIGSSVEFDWCGVSALNTFKKEKFETIVVNYNPETVSTDYDACGKLYFDELSLERVLDIYDKEKPSGILVSTGGQIPNNLVMKLHKNKVKVWGTDPENIDKAENRHKFSALLDSLKVDQPLWKEFSKIKDAYKFARKVGYPVLVRPSYVLSGAAMSVSKNENELKNYLSKAIRLNREVPVVISKFEKGAKEIEIDGVARKGNLLIWAISEHVENAGVHSGDATIVLPPQRLYLETIRRVKQIAKKIAGALKITGPFNIQFLAKNNYVKVIECNLRSSRSFPFSSKVTGHNFVEIAVKAILGKIEQEEIRKQKYRTLDLDYVGVKAPQFSFPRLRGADPMLSVEMASTGEVACFGETQEEAFLKSFISVGGRLPKKNILVSIGSIEDKASFLSSAKTLISLGFNLFGTENTAKFLNENNAICKNVYKISQNKKPNIIKKISDKKVDLVINIPKTYAHDEMTDGYYIRRTSIDNNIPLITNLQIAKLLVQAIEKYTLEDLEIKEWSKYK